jgi:hypothetical protein
MSITQQDANQATLARRWQERCQQGNFSAAVLGLGTVRVFGKSGDAPVIFPRIESLEQIEQLEADERWAVETAQQVVQAAQAKQRPVMASQPPRAGVAPAPTPLRTFDPKIEHMLILSLTRGG